MKIAGKTLISNKPFARLQFGMIAGVLALTGTFVVHNILAGSGSLTFSTSTLKVNIGDTVTVGIRENSGTDPVNAVEADVTFDPAKLEYTGVSEAGSAFALVASTKVSPGSLKFARGISGGNAALTGDNLVTTVTFKALTTGAAPLAFGTGSALVRSTDSSDILASKNPLALDLEDLSAPTIPTNLAAPATTLTSVGITWTPSTDNVGVTGYDIFRNGVEVGDSTSTNYTDTNLLPGTDYLYSVRATDSAGNDTAESQAVKAHTLADTIAPTRPGVPTVTAQSPVSVVLTWAPATDNVAVTGYEVYRNGELIATQDTEELSGSTSAPNPKITVFDNNIKDTGLAPNTSYEYSVVAVDYTYNKSVKSPVATIKTLEDITNPSAPQGLSGSVSGQTITLTWTASGDDSGVAGYTIFRDGTQIGTALPSKYIVQNAAIGSHKYTVQAYDIVGNKSALSNSVTIGIFGLGDINRDGVINVFDLSAVLGEWGKAGANASDLNGDSMVNVMDLSIVLAHWTG